MFFSGVLFPIFLVISLAVDEGGPMAIPFIALFCVTRNDALRTSIQRQKCAGN